MMIELKQLLLQASSQDFTDMFFTPGSPPVMKVNGTLRSVGGEPLTAEMTQGIARQILNEEQFEEFKTQGDYNLAFGVKNVGRFRVNIYRQRGAISVVLRRIVTDIPPLEALRLPEIMGKLALEKMGLILVTGATGTGKSTTLASMVEHRNQQMEGHTVTIEDPIEFLHVHKKSLISQREVGVDTPSFQDALQNVLRQSPDVIVIGEIRNARVMSDALYAAETGHLVLATLHSSNTVQAIEKILSFFPSESQKQVFVQLAYSLKAILSQRLLPEKGEKGQVPAIEILLNSSRIQDMLLNQNVKDIKQAVSEATQEGMCTFDQSIYKLHQDGIIDDKTALLFADSPNNMRLKLKNIQTITNI